MKTVLHVAEKPSVAKAISGILSNSPSQRRGDSKYNPIFSFSFDFQGHRRNMVFTSVTGHLMERDFGRSYKRWDSTPPERLFTAPIQRSVASGKSALAKQLRAEARKADTLVLWLDCDREGENICFEVMEVCQKVNPRLKIMRARFSSIVPRDIQRAIANLTVPNKRESDAVDARAEMDLRVGAVFTRFLSLRFRGRPGLDNTISYGPCQFPTLGFVVHRYNAIAEFVSEPFWKLKLQVEKNGKKCVPEWDRGRLFDEGACRTLCSLIARNPVVVRSASTKPTRKYRPFPLNTVKLQQLAASRLKMASQDLMNVAEKLYQRGYISYPRTETDAFVEGTPFDSLIGEQTHNNKWGNYARSLLGGMFVAPKKGKHNDQAHTAIHPTKRGDDLSGTEAKVYELITRHFLACCSQDALGDQTVVCFEMGGETFTAKGLMVRELNFLEVYPYIKWSQNSIPSFVVGERLNASQLSVEDGETSPPSLISEKELITLMDKHGIGTDATIAQHIHKIQERSYVVKQGMNFTPTNLGMALINGYDKMGLTISHPNLRAQCERELVEICEGRDSKEAVVDRNVAAYTAVYRDQLNAIGMLEAEFSHYFPTPQNTQIKRSFSACGTCGGKMDLKGADLSCAACNTSFSLKLGGGKARPSDKVCPICNFQVISVEKQGKKGPWVDQLCPCCSSNPPQEYFGNSAATQCSSCSHPSCSLAGYRGSLVRPCSCGSNLSVRRSNDGRLYLSCVSYPDCKHRLFLPPHLSLQLSSQDCPTCSAKWNGPVKKLDMAFAKHNAIPGHPKNTTVCIGGCDKEMHLILQGMNKAEDLAVTKKGRKKSIRTQTTRTANPSSSVASSANKRQKTKEEKRKTAEKMTIVELKSAIQGRGLVAPKGCSKWKKKDWVDFYKAKVESTINRNRSSGYNNSGRGYATFLRVRDNNLQNNSGVVPSPNFSVSNESSRYNNNNFGGNRNNNNFNPGNNMGHRSNNSNNSNNNNNNNRYNNTFNGNNNRSNVSNGKSYPLCLCGMECNKFQTKKAGPNEGRWFFACETRLCDFFEWEDQMGKTSSFNNNNNNNFGGNRNNNNNNNFGGNRNNNNNYNNNGRRNNINNKTIQYSSFHCKCGVPAQKFVVFKEGPNRGRCFLKCGKQSTHHVHKGCGYFEWEDEAGNNNNNNNFGGNRNNNGRRKYIDLNLAGGEGKRGGNCFKCNETGHWASDCPNS